ncbi:MAG: carbohydrate ABC transporter permease [Candidatus Atribacteria bacterium]|nr:carbohydrate ABC transporter permease [Candidatus Atribacteria bacterium]
MVSKRKIYIQEQVKSHAVSIIVALIMIIPFIWMILSSFKPGTEIVRMPPTFFPETFTTKNYVTLFQRLPFGRYFINSIIMSGGITLISMFSSSLLGYVFAKFKFRFKNFFFFLLLSGFMIPFATLVIPMYLFISSIHLTNHYLGLILPFCISPFGIFLMRQFMEDIPNDYMEAARLDGASELWIYSRIILPLTSAALGGVAIYNFLMTWNQLWWPLMVTSQPNMRTLPLGVAALALQQGKRYDLLITGASVSVIPIIILFAIAQKQIIKGLSVSSGLKM